MSGNLVDIGSLAEEDKTKFVANIEQRQISDSLRMYNSLVESCFTECVDTFQRKSLDKQEESCIRQCCHKFLMHSMRVSVRSGENKQGTAPNLSS